MHSIVSDSCPVEQVLDEEFVSADLLSGISPPEDSSVAEEEPTHIEDEFYSQDYSEARNYIAGYICKKLHLPQKDSTRTSSWVSVKGSQLMEPNSELIEIVAKCDETFNLWKEKVLKAGNDPLGKLKSLILKEHPNFPHDVVVLFCKVKFFACLKDLNIKLKVGRGNTASVRCLKQTGQFLN